MKTIKNININYWALLINAWKQLFKKKTLIIIGIDLLLIISLLLTIFLASGSERLISNDLQKLVVEGQQLQAKGLSNDAIAGLLASKYNPNLTLTTIEIVISYFLFLILGVAVFAFFKTWTWSKLMNEKLSKNYFKKMFFLNESWLLTTIILPILLSLKYPVMSAYLFLSLVFLTIIFLPAFYIVKIKDLKIFFRKMFFQYLIVWGIILSTTIILSIILGSLITILGLSSNQIIVFINLLLSIMFFLLLFIGTINFSRYYITDFFKKIGVLSSSNIKEVKEKEKLLKKTKQRKQRKQKIK